MVLLDFLLNHDTIFVPEVTDPMEDEVVTIDRNSMAKETRSCPSNSLLAKTFAHDLSSHDVNVSKVRKSTFTIQIMAMMCKASWLVKDN